MTDFYKEVGIRIRELRNAKKITQEELAAAAELSLMTTHRIKTGKTETSTYNLFSIVKFL